MFLICITGSSAFAEVNKTVSCDIVPSEVIRPAVRRFSPPIVIASASNVPSKSPLTASILPLNIVAVTVPELGLYVKSPSASKPRLPAPAAPSINVIWFSSSVLSLSTMVTWSAVPVVSWLRVSTAITEFVAVKPEPANNVAKEAIVVNCSVLPSESNVNILSPLAGVTSENSDKSIAKETVPPVPPPDKPAPAVTPDISPIGLQPESSLKNKALPFAWEL